MDTPVQPLNIPTPIPDIPKPPMKREIIAAIIVIIFGAIFLIGLKLFILQNPNTPVIVEKLLPTPTPTPTRLLSALATQSAFLKLEANVASLSAAINNYVVDDPSLSPPVLELRLGF